MLYDPIGLDEMMGVSFMSRLDTKYLFPLTKLPLLLKQCQGMYRILEIDNQREFSYKTVYFDTPALLFYNQHVTGKLNRNKVRMRTYENNSLTFLEVKHKSNKGRTYKSRIQTPAGDNGDTDESANFLNELIAEDTGSLKPVITTGFRRITLVSLLNPERVTIDFGLSWINLKGDGFDFPFMAVAEIKRDKTSAQSPFFVQLKKLGIRSTGFSKYCLGMAILNDVPKKNLLKSKLLLINKIKNEYDKNGVA